jgi:hypothetical protein
MVQEDVNEVSRTDDHSIRPDSGSIARKIIYFTTSLLTSFTHTGTPGTEVPT